uniref:Uncharacterized protein n=1 Tax=viral metagenome TaxID=1070528 RepID=A0A6C0C0H1_9ZZZZ
MDGRDDTKATHAFCFSVLGLLGYVLAVVCRVHQIPGPNISGSVAGYDKQTSSYPEPPWKEEAICIARVIYYVGMQEYAQRRKLFLWLRAQRS